MSAAVDGPREQAGEGGREPEWGRRGAKGGGRGGVSRRVSCCDGPESCRDVLSEQAAQASIMIMTLMMTILLMLMMILMMLMLSGVRRWRRSCPSWRRWRSARRCPGRCASRSGNSEIFFQLFNWNISVWQVRRRAQQVDRPRVRRDCRPPSVLLSVLPWVSQSLPAPVIVHFIKNLFKLDELLSIYALVITLSTGQYLVTRLEYNRIKIFYLVILE